MFGLCQKHDFVKVQNKAFHIALVNHNFVLQNVLMCVRLVVGVGGELKMNFSGSYSMIASHSSWKEPFAYCMCILRFLSDFILLRTLC